MISNTELLIVQNLIKELDSLYQLIIQPDREAQLKNLAKNGGKLKLSPINSLITIRDVNLTTTRRAIQDGLIILQANNHSMECALDYGD